MRHPFYIGLGTLLCGYLAIANLRGWSLVQQMTPTRWFQSGPSHFHK